MLAIQPVEAPGGGSDAIQLDQSLTGGKKADITGGSESDEDLQSEPGSPVDGNLQGDLPDKDDRAEQDLSEETSNRETIRGGQIFHGLAPDP